MSKLFTSIGALIALCASFGAPVHAAQFEMAGDYIIHYNAVNTAILDPKVAQNYGIVRSKHRALLNIAVRKKGSDAEPGDTAVRAVVSANAVNLSSQLQRIDLQEVSEPGAIYYLGTFNISNADNLNFTLEVDPEGQGNPHIIKFRQEFFVD